MIYGVYDGSSVIGRFSTPLEVRNNHPEFSGDALSLKRYKVRRPAQRWEIIAPLVPMSTSANDLLALLLDKGDTGQLQIVMPQNYGSVQARTATSTVFGSGTRDSDTVSISGNNGLIPAGTFVRIGSSNKIYLTLTPRQGDGAVRVRPTLRSDVSGEVKYREDVISFFELLTDAFSGMKYTDGILMDLGTLTFIEAL